MENAIPHTYRNVVRARRCYGALGPHEVVRYRKELPDLSDCVRRLHAIIAANPSHLRCRLSPLPITLPWAEREISANHIGAAFGILLASARGERCSDSAGPDATARSR